MRKITYVFCWTLWGIGGSVFAQTGMNTTTPKATLEVVAGQSISAENGVLIPRTTGLDLVSNDAQYTAEQDGTMIFVTEAVPTASMTSKTSEITKRGMYVYHHRPYERWIPSVSGKTSVTANKVFVMINCEATRLMTANTEAIRWNPNFEGVNKNLVRLVGNTEVVLPPFRTLKIQGMIPIGYGAGTEANKKVASSLRSDLLLVSGGADARVYSSTPGFARSSNYNRNNQGGATPAMMIIYTGSAGATIKANATREGTLRTNIAGGIAHNTIGSYLIIEEI
ncbi:hypothetical protein [Flavobacterium sp. JP2137]|uniref:hypothetical protein n=1 Tax=Flavobacterium sp. JP2137 TaxID=3414510 RepID=UPI003D2F9FA9